MNEYIQKNQDRGQWTAVRTKPRCEKQLSRFAEVKNIPFYLPLLRRRKRYQRRQVETLIPMFPGYVFVQIQRNNTDILFESNRVAHILPVQSETEENRLIRELNDVRVIELAELEKELIVNPDIIPGRPVLISEGPLRGCHGIVEKRDDRARVTVNLELLGNSVTAIMDLREVELNLEE